MSRAIVLTPQNVPVVTLTITENDIPGLNLNQLSTKLLRFEFRDGAPSITIRVKKHQGKHHLIEVVK